MKSRPAVNYILLAVNILIFFAGFNGMDANIHKIRNYMLDPQQPMLFQFFTSMFLHQNLMHLLGNMLFLWVFGNAVNDKLRNVGYLAFYLGGGLLAGIGYVMLAGRAPVLGASGAISAVTGAYLVLLPRTRVTVLFWFYIITTFEVSSLFFLALQFVQNLVMSHPSLASARGVAYVAHSSGYAYGIIIGFFLLATHLLERDQYDLLNIIMRKHKQVAFKNMARNGFNPFAQKHKKWVKIETIHVKTNKGNSSKDAKLRSQIAKFCQIHDTKTAAAKYLELLKHDKDAILSQQYQLDIANQLMSEQQHHQAAEAYEKFIRVYNSYEYIGDIFLMLGLIYGRYLQKPQKAKEMFETAISKIKDPQKIDMAKKELEKIKTKFY